MATLILQTAGAALGGALGGPVGAFLGRAIGAVAGAAVDARLFGSASGHRAVEGPRLTDLDGLAASEGAAVPRVYGRARIGAQLIWATRFEEVVTTQTTRARGAGGKGGLGGGGSTTTTTTYSYFGHFAVGLCEGPIALVRRIWLDGTEVDQTTMTLRVHRGTEDQMPDPLIVAKEGADQAPAYRGLAYLVFERLPLAPYGNRLPQVSVEVVRPLGGLAQMVRHVCVIPASTEYGYDTVHVQKDLGLGTVRSENRFQLSAPADAVASIDALLAICPALERVSLVVSWFGTDLRVGACRIEPRVDEREKRVPDHPWRVAGLDRASAHVVSTVNGRGAFGGSPSDASVLRLIAHLKERGIAVVLYPFLQMDVPAGNGLPDPYGGPEQPVYPWRGRITCLPAPGRPGSPDATPAIAAQIAAFLGTTTPGDIAWADGTSTSAQPDDWSLRRLVLHYARLAEAAGGVFGFIIGSELVGVTRLRSAPGVYPAAAALAALARDAASILGPGTVITYAADWTEYGSHVIDGGDEVRFPLDPLWAEPAVGAVGIDFYPPLSDWRDGASHADARPGRTAYDRASLAAGLRGGEAYDWYYASTADRLAQTRTPITDGAYGKPWIYRVKDLPAWWSERHVERVGQVEMSAPTAWVPRSKPIWLTEFGIPAVDKAANGPNVFPDPKSSEDRLPPLSLGHRDDLIQRRALEAVLAALDPAHADHDPLVNPARPDGAPMIDPRAVALWAWDARPYPAFPRHEEAWADAPNWDRGHWITGRIEGGGIDDLLRAILADYGMPPPEMRAVDGFVDGYVIERTLSARAAIEPLLPLYGLTADAGRARLRFAGPAARDPLAIAASDLVPDREGETVHLVRTQETELPRELRVQFTDADGDYRRATARARSPSPLARRESQADLAIVLRRSEAQRLADAWLRALWIGRETASFRVGPHRRDLEIGDEIVLEAVGAARRYRIARIVDGEARDVHAAAIEPGTPSAAAPDTPRPVVRAPLAPGRPHALVLDLPIVVREPPVLQWLAARADPWPGALALHRETAGSFDLQSIVPAPSAIGRTLGVLPPGPLWRFDRGAVLDILLEGAFPSSVPDLAALAGANVFAIRGSDGAWEILAAARAQLIAGRTWRLSRLLRGLGQSEPAARRAVPAGADIVLLDSSLTPLATGLAELGREGHYRLGPAGRDVGDPAFVAFTATPGPAALRPPAPVHVRATRDGGDILLGWIRRTRIDGDGWDTMEVPLGEEAERYAVEIATPSGLRRLSCAEPTLRYASEIVDFGAPQTQLTLSIRQLSTAAGPGAPWSGIVRVRP